jgi:hypothetical protein
VKEEIVFKELIPMIRQLAVMMGRDKPIEADFRYRRDLQGGALDVQARVRGRVAG